jgi:hypothetical protein
MLSNLNSVEAVRLVGSLIDRWSNPTISSSTLRASSLRYEFDRTVIVTVIAVGMVQVATDEIIDMVTVRHRLVPTTGAVLVTDLVTAAIMVGRAALRVLRTDFQDMVLNERRAGGANRMMEVAVVEVIDMVDVFDDGMAAVGAVLVTVVGMGIGSAHKVRRLVNREHGRSEAKTQLSIQSIATDPWTAALTCVRCALSPSG